MEQGDGTPTQRVVRCQTLIAREPKQTGHRRRFASDLLMEAVGIAPASQTEASPGWRANPGCGPLSPVADVRAPPPTLVLSNPSARTPCLEAESCLEHELAVSRKQDDGPWRGIRIREAVHRQRI
jgi:hypothetical protein